MIDSASMAPIAARAIEYIQRGWVVIPVHARGKRPIEKRWPLQRIAAEQAPNVFHGEINLGVILGDVSGGLVDVDLDCPEAIAVAPQFLLPTQMFGRASSRRSHWLYYARCARTERFLRPIGTKLETLVELRANKGHEDSEGLQTVFPGSVHESGEAIEWEADSAPAPSTIAPERLRKSVAQIAVAALLMRSGWALERAVAFVRSPRADCDVDDVSYARVARWLGLSPRAPRPISAPRPQVDNRLERAAKYLTRIPGAVSGNGGHQQSWQAALCIVRGFDLDEHEAYSLLARDYNPRCEPPWSERELQHKVRDAAANGRAERGWLLRAERPHLRASGSDGPYQKGGGHHETAAGMNTAPASPFEWEPPIHFDAFDLPPFPIDALPDALADFVRALAEATQTPPDLAGLQVLAACSAAVAKRVVVEVKPGYREPVNLFTAVILPPGERKSAVVREVIAPLIEWENKAAAAAAGDISRSAQRYAVSAKRLEAAISRAAKAKNKAERAQLDLESEELAEEHAKLTVVVEPRLLADDATPEALTTLLAVHGGRIAIISDEGGVFNMMAGGYSDTPKLDVYLKGHAGGEIRVDRKGRAAERVSDPALTLGLAVQPIVMKALAEKQILRGTGIVARFLYAMPTSMMGSRDVDAQPMNGSIRDGYASALRTLLVLQESPRPIVLPCAPSAYARWREFSQWLEPKLAPDAELESIRDWAAKLAGAVARIAGLMSILRILSTDSLKPISNDLSISTYVVDEESMVRAIGLGKYLVTHAEAVISSMGAEPTVEAAKHIARWIRRKACKSFSRREIQQSTKHTTLFDAGERLERALSILVDRNFIRLAPQPGNAGPGRPSVVYEVNPDLLSSCPEISAQNPQKPAERPSGEREPGEDDE